MGGNLAKAPLIAVFYAGLLWLVAGILPRSEAYANLANEFVMPASGLLMLLPYALCVCIAVALAFGGAKGGGFGLVLFLLPSVCGIQWVAPMLPAILLGEPTGTLTRNDLLMQLAGGCAGSLLLLFLLLLTYKSAAPAATEVKYKLKALGLVIRMLVLPVLYAVAYYLLWYFFLWKVDAARAYYGQTELQNLMGELIAKLIHHGNEVVFVLIQGFAYTFFAIPLLLQIPGKRVLFIASNTFLHLSVALNYLVPSPVMPPEVRTPHFLFTIILAGVYGILSGVLLHTSYKKVVAPAPAKKKAADTAEEPSPAAAGAK